MVVHFQVNGFKWQLSRRFTLVEENLLLIYIAFCYVYLLCFSPAQVFPIILV